MSRLGFLIRFFRAAPPVQPLMGVGFAATLLLVTVVVVVDVGRVAAALAPILLLQTFAVSSGFAGPARRGHYDLALTTGRGRLEIACVHWAMSACPGVAAWLMVAAIETVVRQDVPVVSLSSGTFAAMFLVSTAPWAVTVPLPRLTGGIGWVLLFVTAIAVVPAGQREAILAASEEGTVLTGMAIVVCPWILIGRDLAAGSTIPVASAIVVSSLAMAAAMAWIERIDLPLEAGQ